MKTVGELKDALDKFPSSMRVVFRRVEGDGFYSDLTLNEPMISYPEKIVCFSASTSNAENESDQLRSVLTN